MAEVILKVCQDLSIGAEGKASVTPANGAKVIIKEFIADLPTGNTIAAKLIWKFEHVSEPEEVLWVIRAGRSSMPDTIEITNANGVRKLGLSIENNSTVAPQAVAGYVRVEII